LDTDNGDRVTRAAPKGTSAKALFAARAMRCRSFDPTEGEMPARNRTNARFGPLSVGSGLSMATPPTNPMRRMTDR